MNELVRRHNDYVHGMDPCHNVPDTQHTGLCSEACFIVSEKNDILVKSFDTEYILGHAILKAISHVSRLKFGYLCTGYTAYLFTEPCLSCAMALVHGRIKNVFVYSKRSQDGFSSFSHLKFNYNKFLNHRYNVYFYQN